MILETRGLAELNPQLIPLIAHDRAGFGGGVATAGLLLFASVWCGTESRSLWQALLLGGIAGWSTAIGIHPFVVGTPAGAAALRRVLENFKKQKLVWVTDVEAVLTAAGQKP